MESTERFDSFADEITRLPDGRYCTPIPWKTDKWRLQRNLKMASCRIDSTLVRLRKNPQDLADYDKEIQQLITNQFVDKADMEYDGHHMHVFAPSSSVSERQIDNKNSTRFRRSSQNKIRTEFERSVGDGTKPESGSPISNYAIPDESLRLDRRH